MSRKTTYDRHSDKPVPAKYGICDGCGKNRPIISVTRYGSHCSACFQRIWKDWHDRSERKQGTREDDGEPFELEGE